MRIISVTKEHYLVALSPEELGNVIGRQLNLMGIGEPDKKHIGAFFDLQSFMDRLKTYLAMETAMQEAAKRLRSFADALEKPVPRLMDRDGNTIGKDGKIEKRTEVKVDPGPTLPPTSKAMLPPDPPMGRPVGTVRMSPPSAGPANHLPLNAFHVNEEEDDNSRSFGGRGSNRFRRPPARRE